MSTPIEPAQGCVAQTYWYKNGEQRARFCPEPATRMVRALDGRFSPACQEHAAGMLEAGAFDVTEERRR